MAERRYGRRGNARNKYQKPKDLRKTLKNLLRYIGKSSWLLVVVGICIVLNTACTIAGSYLLKPIINEGIVPGDYRRLALLLVMRAVVYLGALITTYSYHRIMVHVSQNTTHAIRRDLFAKMQRLPLRFFDSHTHGELMSRYTNDVETVTEILNNGFVNLLSGVLTFLGVVGMMLSLNPLLFLITVGFLGIMILVVYIVGKRSRVYFAVQQKNLGRVNGFVEEMIEGLKVVKVFNREKLAKRDFAERNEAFRQSATVAQYTASSLMPILTSLSHMNYAVTCCIGALMAISGRIDLGTLVVFLNNVRQVSSPVSQMSQQVNNIMSAVAGAERIFEVMEELPETDEGKTVLVYVQQDENGVLRESTDRTGEWAWKKPEGTLVPLTGDVRFCDVVFGYDAKKTVLHGISLYAKSGQKIAFVGSTGAGKTTITNLINRFYDINSGQITYDGIDIQDIQKDSLRSSLGIVLQDTHLFTGTIADNIRYGKLDATDEEVRRAAKIANADTFIRHLPKGYDTWITGDGGSLSQGERQLLAIARAAVADPPVLILDEATSSIDTRTEKLIEKGMDQLMQGRTVFVIAHRLSTVRNAKAILVLEQGEIIERGNHEQLLQQQGRYYKLYTGSAELS